MVKSSARSSARIQQQAQHVLKASVNDVRMLAGMLRPISVSPQATFRISSLGVEVITEAHRAVVAKAWIQKDLFTSYSFNPPGFQKKKKKKTNKISKKKNNNNDRDDSETRLDEFLNRQNSEKLTSSNIAKTAFGTGSEISHDGNSSLNIDSVGDRAKNQRENDDEEEDEEEEEDENDENELEEDLEYQQASLETDLNLNHFIECLDIFGGAPALKGPSNNKSDSSNNHANEDDAITEEFRRRARERRERNGEESPERRTHSTGNRNPRDEKDKTALRMSWEGHGYPFVLLLEEQNVVTRCELSTIETYEIRDLGFSSSEDVAKAIINSEWLQSAFSSVDPSASSLSILFSPSYKPATSTNPLFKNGIGGGGGGGDETIDTTMNVNDDGEESWMLNDSRNDSRSIKKRKKDKKKGKAIQMLKLSADGDFGSSVIELPVDPAVVFEFHCQYETENKYNFNHLSHLLKALSASTKVAIRVNEIGYAIFQFLMPKGTGSNLSENPRNRDQDQDGNSGCGFVDFYILPLQQIQLEEEEDENGSGESEDG